MAWRRSRSTRTTRWPASANEVASLVQMTVLPSLALLLVTIRIGLSMSVNDTSRFERRMRNDSSNDVRLPPWPDRDSDGRRLSGKTDDTDLPRYLAIEGARQTRNSAGAARAHHKILLQRVGVEGNDTEHGQPNPALEVVGRSHR